VGKEDWGWARRGSVLMAVVGVLLAAAAFAAAAQAAPLAPTAGAGSVDSAGPATQFTVLAPATATAGEAITLVVDAEDATDQPTTDYSGIVQVTSTDPIAALPTDLQLTNGTGTFNATLGTVGIQTLTATDTTTPSITGTSNSISVQPGPATHYSVTAPADSTAGDSFNLVVTALDVDGNVATGYTGTAAFSSTDPSNDLNQPGSLTNGVATFPATLDTEGVQTVTATDTTDPTITGTSDEITVNPSVATTFTVKTPAKAMTGQSFMFTVTGHDGFGNPGAAAGGLLHFSSTDASAVLPADTPFTGHGTFSATLGAVGDQTITVNDSANPQSTGTSPPIPVSPQVASRLLVTTPSSAAAGTPASFTVQALDATGNTVTGYAGTVHFTSTDPAATIPADAMLTNGTGAFQATFRAAGSATLTATDTTDSSITGTGRPTSVVPGPATTFRLSAPPATTAGAPFSFTVKALDAFGNNATGYAGTIHFTSTDGAASVPPNSGLTNGMGTFTATLGTAGSQTVSAHDAADPTIAGTSGAITVPALAAKAPPPPPSPPAPPPPPPPTPPPAPVPKPSNQFFVPRVHILTDGTITFTVKVAGPGAIDVLETAWDDNVARVSVRLHAAPMRFVAAQAHRALRAAGTFRITVAPTPRGRQLLRHHRYRVTLRLWVTYTPTGGVYRTHGFLGLHPPGH
jgi:hypothetical protein